MTKSKKLSAGKRNLTFEEQRMISVIIGTGLTINSYLEHLIDNAPGIVRHDLKKAYNDTVRLSEELHARMFVGKEKNLRYEMSQRMVDISKSFEKWIDDTFIPVPENKEETKS